MPAHPLTSAQIEAQRLIAGQLAEGATFGTVQLQFRATLNRTVDVVAEHFAGHDGRALTRLTSSKRLSDGGHFLANLEGHLPDGSLHTLSGHNGFTYRAAVVGERMARVQRRAAA